MPIIYPRPCPTCGKKIKHRGDFSRHKKYCGKNTPRVQCIHCESTFKRKDDMLKHVRKFHSAATKRKAEESAELVRLELLHADKVPRLSVESQTGGTVTFGKRALDEGESTPAKASKNISEQEVDDSDEYGGGSNPLFKANIDKMGPPKSWKKGKVIDQKFTFSLEQLREEKPDEDLGVGAVHALLVGMDNLIDDMNIDKTKYELALQIGSKEHFKDTGPTGETWHIPADDYYKRTLFAQTMFDHIARVLNSGEFITADRGFTASMTLIRRDVKGGKNPNYRPGEKIWEEVVKDMRCVYEVKNKDQLCCGRAMGVMREYVQKRQSLTPAP